MSSVVDIKFGNSYREKFGYLIITAIMVFLCSTAVNTFAEFTSDPEFFAKYDLFYTMAGAMVGLLASQVFIKIHLRSIKKRKF